MASVTVTRVNDKERAPATPEETNLVGEAGSSDDHLLDRGKFDTLERELGAVCCWEAAKKN